MTLALVALGSNIPPRRATLAAAVEDLAALSGTKVLAVSTLRETEPVDCAADAPAFVNGACLLETTLIPLALLDALLGIERRHGRVRMLDEGRHAPRTLDLDLILHGETIMLDDELTLPHPRAHERLFVMQPAAEVAPDMLHPVLGVSLTALRDGLLPCGR